LLKETASALVDYWGDENSTKQISLAPFGWWVQSFNTY
jgi:hypothetical protein